MATQFAVFGHFETRYQPAMFMDARELAEGGAKLRVRGLVGPPPSGAAARGAAIARHRREDGPFVIVKGKGVLLRPGQPAANVATSQTMNRGATTPIDWEGHLIQETKWYCDLEQIGTDLPLEEILKDGGWLCEPGGFRECRLVCCSVEFLTTNLDEFLDLLPPADEQTLPLGVWFHVELEIQSRTTRGVLRLSSLAQNSGKGELSFLVHEGWEPDLAAVHLRRDRRNGYVGYAWWGDRQLGSTRDGVIDHFCKTHGFDRRGYVCLRQAGNWLQAIEIVLREHSYSINVGLHFITIPDMPPSPTVRPIHDMSDFWLTFPLATGINHTEFRWPESPQAGQTTIDKGLLKAAQALDSISARFPDAMSILTVLTPAELSLQRSTVLRRLLPTSLSGSLVIPPGVLALDDSIPYLGIAYGLCAIALRCGRLDLAKAYESAISESSVFDEHDGRITFDELYAYMEKRGV